MTDECIEANLRGNRWSRIYPGVYATFTGELPRSAQIWAVLLWAGPGTALSHETAAEAAELLKQPSDKIHITVPHDRHLRRQVGGVVVHRSSRIAQVVHPSRTPPQTRLEETVVDLTQAAPNLDEALGWLARAVGADLTTPARLSAALDRRPRLRWRPALTAAVEDVAKGCQSLLELAFLRDVERAHGLPVARRQVMRVRRGGRCYDDVFYEDYGTRIELDGLDAHPFAQRIRDRRADNAALIRGDLRLRFYSGDVFAYPCQCALDLSTVLAANGWKDPPHPCRRPACVIEKP